MPRALSTDLYEIAMAGGYYVYDEWGRASFELWVRELPSERGYLVAAGLEQALGYLETVQFSAEEIDYLRKVPALRNLPASFFDEYLRTFEFGGDVWAVPEGTPVFAGEPLLRVTAALPAAQMVETVLLSTTLFQTMVASKASRIVRAAQGRPVVEFGARRAHGTQAAARAARAAYIGGCVGTSDLEAGAMFGLEVSGTMAHSWVMTHENEELAFRRYMDLYGDQSVLVMDTYETLGAARLIVEARLRPRAVRLDSGDLDGLSREVRRILDAGGCEGTKILASGDLDEYRIHRLVTAKAPIDGFGVGTALSTSYDAPALSGVYKLVETERNEVVVPTLKLSPGKETHPGPKQVWRVMSDGAASHDVVGQSQEETPDGLLQLVMEQGRRLLGDTSLRSHQVRCRDGVDQLPPSVTRLDDPDPYPVRISPALTALTTTMRLRASQMGQDTGSE